MNLQTDQQFSAISLQTWSTVFTNLLTRTIYENYFFLVFLVWSGFILVWSEFLSVRILGTPKVGFFWKFKASKIQT
jgi:hypothetical protein